VSLGYRVKQAIYPIMFVHVSTCIYVSYRQDEPFLAKQQRKQYVSTVYCCDKNLEQRINIKFCVKIGNSASEMVALLTLACGEYAVKKSSVSEWHSLLTFWRLNVF
jgi:hypothetical protein